MDGWERFLPWVFIAYCIYRIDVLSNRIAELAKRINGLEYRTQLPHDESQADWE